MEEIEVKEQRVDENLAESNRWRREEKGLMRLREEEEEDRSLFIMASIENEEKRKRQIEGRGREREAEMCVARGEREKVTIKANVQLSHERESHNKS